MAKERTKNVSEIMEQLCNKLGFELKAGATEKIYEKKYQIPKKSDYWISVNFSNGGSIDYGKDIAKGRGTTSNFQYKEAAAVLECVDRLITKHYEPSCIELEYAFSTGHGGAGSSNFLDILVKRSDGTAYMMIECKNYGNDYDKERKCLIQNDNSNGKPNQLISYFDKDTNADVLVLYASRVNNGSIEIEQSIIYTEALKSSEYHNATERFNAWNKETSGFGVFEDGVDPYFRRDKMHRGDLIQLNEKLSSEIFNGFLEILRHNSISDKPNAFNKILNLFLCKIVDENKGDNEVVEFYWDTNTDYRSMQNTLESLYKRGMNDFLQIDKRAANS